MGVSVQVSFYALNGSDVAVPVDRFVAALERHGLSCEVGTMSTVIWGELDDIFAALHDAYEQASAGIAAIMTITVSNACPVS